MKANPNPTEKPTPSAAIPAARPRRVLLPVLGAGLALLAGLAGAATPAIKIIDRVEAAGPIGDEIVEAIEKGNIARLDAIFDQELWDIDQPIATYEETTADNRYIQVDNGFDTLTCWGAPTLQGTPLMVAARLGRVRIVKHLLERGANPNVMIRTAGIDLEDAWETFPGGSGLFGFDPHAPRQHKSRAWGPALAEAERPFLCALTDAYLLPGVFPGKTPERADEIGRLLVEAGAVPPPEDVWGRNGLWDAAIARSPRFLDLCLAHGLNPAEEDNVGNTVMSSIETTLKTMGPNDTRRAELIAFRKALEKAVATDR